MNEEQNSLEKFPPNFALLALLEGKAQNSCKIYSDELTILCLQDRIKICRDCALFGEHKGHPIQKLKELKARGMTVKKDLGESLKEFKKCQFEKAQELENKN